MKPRKIDFKNLKLYDAKDFRLKLKKKYDKRVAE